MKSRKAQAKLEGDALFDYAVRVLAARASTCDELRFKLRRRAAALSEIDPVIERLRDLGYLNDQRFAEMYTAMRMENDGYGKTRVLQDLRKRRVAPSLADRAVSHAYRDQNEDEMVTAFIERRMPSISAGGHIDDERKLAAAYRKLRRAGFTSGAVLTALKRFAAHPELLEEPPPEDESQDA
jgi:regulatory protein